jgi:hypothetical protein
MILLRYAIIVDKIALLGRCEQFLFGDWTYRYG